MDKISLSLSKSAKYQKGYNMVINNDYYIKISKDQFFGLVRYLGLSNQLDKWDKEAYEKWLSKLAEKAKK